MSISLGDVEFETREDMGAELRAWLREVGDDSEVTDRDGRTALRHLCSLVLGVKADEVVTVKAMKRSTGASPVAVLKDGTEALVSMTAFWREHVPTSRMRSAPRRAEPGQRARPAPPPPLFRHDMSWQRRSACAASSVDFFDDETQEAALALCGTCPVRGDCLQFALDSKQIHGVWGGATPNQIRRALGVDDNGHPVRRKRPIRCAWCGAIGEKINVRPYKAKAFCECTDCGLTWVGARTRIPRPGARRDARLSVDTEELSETA